MTAYNIMDLSKEVTKAAKSVTYQWPGIVEADDLEQDIYMKLLETPNSVEKLLNDFDDKQRLNAIIQIGHQIASKERADYDVFSGNFRYSVDEVRRLLENRALHHEDPSLGSNWTISEDYVKGGEFEDAVLTKLASETDLRNGMKRLRKANPGYADMIQRRYFTGESIVEGSDRTRLSRALTALATQMNRSFKRQFAERPDGPGTRKATHRRSAQVKSSQQYDGSHEGWMTDWTAGKTG